MKRHIRIIIILVISMFLFNINEVNAKSICGTDCESICQYYTTSTTNTASRRTLHIFGKYKSNNQLYDIQYRQDYASQFMGGTNTMCETGLMALSRLTVEYLDVESINNYGAEGVGYCAKNAYITEIKPTAEGNACFVCFDNDGKYCKKKYSTITKDNEFSIDEEGETIKADGTKSILQDDDATAEARKAAESTAIKRNEEQRLILQKKQRQSGSDCKSILGPVVTEDVNKVLKYIQYIGPILVIVLGILDFIKAVASGSSETFNNAWKKLIKRLIVAILLFFVVILVKFIFGVFGITSPESCL